LKPALTLARIANRRHQLKLPQVGRNESLLRHQSFILTGLGLRLRNRLRNQAKSRNLGIGSPGAKANANPVGNNGLADRFGEDEAEQIKAVANDLAGELGSLHATIDIATGELSGFKADSRTSAAVAKSFTNVSRYLERLAERLEKIEAA